MNITVGAHGTHVEGIAIRKNFSIPLLPAVCKKIKIEPLTRIKTLKTVWGFSTSRADFATLQKALPGAIVR